MVSSATTPIHAIANALGVPPEGDDLVRATLDGVPLEIRVERDEGVPQRYVLFVPRVGLARLTLRPEVDFDRTGKRYGMTTEIEIDDSAFDSIVFVDTAADPTRVRSYLESPAARTAAIAIVGEGDSILVTERGLEVDLRAPHELDVRRAVAHAKALAAFVRSLPPDDEPSPDDPEAPISRWPIRFALGYLLVAWLAFGLSTSVAPESLGRVWLYGLAVDVALTGLAFFVFALRFRTSSQGFGSTIVATIVFFLFVTLPIGPTAVSFANAGLDDASTTESVTLVHRACSTDDDHVASTEVVVRRADGETIATTVAGCLRVPPGTTVALVTSPGGLGLRRIHRVAELSAMPQAGP